MLQNFTVELRSTKGSFRINIRMEKNSIGIYLIINIKLLNNEHKFDNSFRDFSHPLRSCSREVETLFETHFCLHNDHFTDIWKTLIHESQSVNGDILNQPDNEIVELCS